MVVGGGVREKYMDLWGMAWEDFFRLTQRYFPTVEYSETLCPRVPET